MLLSESQARPNMITQEFLKWHDDKWEYNILHNKCPDIKLKKIQAKVEMIKNGLRQMQEDDKEGVGYAPSEDLAHIIETMTGDETASTTRAQKKKTKSVKGKNH